VHALLVGFGLGFLVALQLGPMSLFLIRSTLRRVRPGLPVALAPASRARLFRDGVLVDLLNPKTALFFLAFLPGFVHAGRGAVALQVVVLGLVFVGLAALTDGAYALVTARVSRGMRERGSAGRRLGRVSAGAYGALAVLALAG